MSIKPFIINFSKIGNSELGFISVAEKVTLPFLPKRVYWTYEVPDNNVRGGHAHIDLEQILICLNGVIRLEIETIESEKYEFLLDSPNVGVFLPKKCWRIMTYSESAIQICLASEEYSEKDYIREYSDFLILKKNK